MKVTVHLSVPLMAFVTIEAILNANVEIATTVGNQLFLNQYSFGCLNCCSLSYPLGVSPRAA